MVMQSYVLALFQSTTANKIDSEHTQATTTYFQYKHLPVFKCPVPVYWVRDLNMIFAIFTGPS